MFVISPGSERNILICWFQSYSCLPSDSFLFWQFCSFCYLTFSTFHNQYGTLFYTKFHFISLCCVFFFFLCKKLYVILLCFDLLTRPKIPFKVVHRKEVTHPGRWKSEEVAQALRCVYITAWAFEGNIRPTNWGQLEIGEKEGKQYSRRRR